MPLEPKFPDYVDSTMRTQFAACHQKYYITHILGASLPLVSEHLHFGKTFAKGLEVVRKAYYANNMSSDDALHEGFHAVLDKWGDFDPPEGSVKNLENCCKAYELYFTHWPLAEDHLIPYRSDAEGAPWIEFTGSIPIPEVPHPITGEPIVYVIRLDMLAAMKSACKGEPWNANEIWAVDEKTTSQMGATWSRQWRLRGQFIGYTWGGSHQGLPMAGACVRGICVYKRRDPEFQEAFIPISPYTVEQWYDQLVRELKEMVRCWETGIWGKVFADACGSYGGCSYISLCELPRPEPYMETTFIERRWNPLNPED